MKKQSAAQVRSSFYGILYGQGKTYKTSLALGIPSELRPCAYLDIDNGAALRQRILSATEEERAAMGVVEDVPDYYGPWIKEGMDFFYPDPDRPFHEQMWQFVNTTLKDYNSCVMDTINRIGDAELEEIKTSGYSNHVTVASGNVKTLQASPADYGLAMDRLITLFKRANQQDCHVLMLSHEKTAEIRQDQKVERILVGPGSIGSKLVEQLPTIVDVVLRLEAKSIKDLKTMKKTNKVLLRTTNHGINLAGDRSGLFADGEQLNPESFWSKVTAMIDMANKE